MKKLLVVLMLVCGTGWSDTSCFDSLGQQVCVDDGIPSRVRVSTKTFSLITSEEFEALESRVKALEDKQVIITSGTIDNGPFFKNWNDCPACVNATPTVASPCPKGTIYYKMQDASGCMVTEESK